MTNSSEVSLKFVDLRCLNETFFVSTPIENISFLLSEIKAMTVHKEQKEEHVFRIRK